MSWVRLRPVEVGQLDLELPTSRSINELAQNVSVTCVPGSLFEKVHEDPAKVDWRFVANVATRLIEARSGVNHSIDLSPDSPVRDNCRFDRVTRVD